MKTNAIEPTALQATPRAQPRPGRDDRFRRALDEQARDDADDDAPRTARATGRERRLGDRREPRPASGPIDGSGAIQPAPLQRELHDWLAALRGGDAGTASADASAITLDGGPGVELGVELGSAPANLPTNLPGAEPTPRAATAPTSDDDGDAIAAVDADDDQGAAVDPREPAPSTPTSEADAAAIDELTAMVTRAPRSHGRDAASEDAASPPTSSLQGPERADPHGAVVTAVSTSSATATAGPDGPARAEATATAPTELDPPTATTAAMATNRARLVLDHDGERVVVSVAVRHGAVSVALDASSSTLGAAVGATLDRLDAALQGHGLHLADLSSGQPQGREPSRPSPPPTPRRPGGAVDVVDGPPPPHSYDPRLRALA